MRAGLTTRPKSPDAPSWVHPRARGGNPAETNTSFRRLRLIPVRAGEPQRYPAKLRVLQVAPRRCGELRCASAMVSRNRVDPPACGGVLASACADWRQLRSIPVRAGEPFSSSKKEVALGRSPCVRGTSGSAGHYRMCGRAIPVGAGGTLPPVCSSSLVGVHPRARGNRGHATTLDAEAGRSPCGRGNYGAVDSRNGRSQVDPRACGV